MRYPQQHIRVTPLKSNAFNGDVTGGRALVELLGGEVDFEVSIEAELTLVLVNGRALGGGGGGGRGAERTD